MSDWKEAKQEELLEKQKHINQKLAQLRDLREILRKWRELMRQYQEWFEGREDRAAEKKFFDIDSLIRMGAIAVQLQSLVGELGQVGDPKATGTGSAGGNEQSLEQREHAHSAELLSDAAGPLRDATPWELVSQLDPETAESVRQGETGAAIASAVFNPYTSLTAVGFGKRMMELSEELVENHPEEFEAMEQGWRDTQEALDQINETLGDIDLDELTELEEALEDTLRGYESVYDSAQGGDSQSAAQLGQAASGR